ncbi:MAG: Asp/Glu/hydantoin racemase [Fulvimarina sp.]|nr:Asp/Glu/hydantoin racemase [Fulvimarina sp.]
MPQILIANPNMSTSVTELLLASGRRVASPMTELVGLTAPRGFPYLSNRVEELIGGAICLEMLAEHGPACDAAIIAAFSDPGILAARQLFGFPVIGMSEAAMLTACMLGRRFAIVTFATDLGDWYHDCVALHGLTGRLAAIVANDEPFADLASVQHEQEERLVTLSLRAVAAGADVIILGGAPLAGLAAQVAHLIPVPVVDPIAAAVRQAETILALGATKPTAGAFQRPAAKPAQGLSPALAARLEHRS